MRFHPDNTIPTGDYVWVFGSNERGAHGKGAAKVARVNFHAEYGVARGPTGNAYAIPTKDKHLGVLPLEAISKSIDEFLVYAREHPKLTFFVTRIGCVLAGYADAEIGPRFAQAPENCVLPEEWREYCGNSQVQALAPAAPVARGSLSARVASRKMFEVGGPTRYVISERETG